MGDRKERIVRFAKQNRWFRYCLIGAYVILCACSALWEKSLSLRKELTACLIVFVLCFSQVFSGIVYAEEAKGMLPEGENTQIENVEEGDVSDGGSEAEKVFGEKAEKTFEEEAEEALNGTGDSEKDASDGSSKEDGMADEADVSGVDNENPGDSTVPTEGEGDISSGEEFTEGSVSGNDPVYEEVSDNDPLDEEVSGNDPVVEEGSGNDPADEEVSRNDSVDEEVSDSDPLYEESVSGNDLMPEEEPVLEEPLYRYIPQLFISCHMEKETAGLLIGNASSTITLSTISSYIEPEDGEETGLSPAVCAYGEVDGEMLYIDLSGGSADISLPDTFYGNITFTAEDREGNVCMESTPTLLIDGSAPVVELVETELSDGSRQITMVCREGGSTATGIAKMRYSIDGEVSSDEYAVTGVAENCFGQAVISEATLPVEIEEAGVYTVRLEAEDHAGNTTACIQSVTVPEKRGPIMVSAPSEVKLIINPWSGGEQIYSDSFTIENKSGYDIIATLHHTRLTVDREDVGGNTSEKDCEVVLSGDISEDINLPEGNSGELLCVRIPAKKEDGETNGDLTLRVYGNLSDGSEKLWKDGDMKLSLFFEYMAAPME